MVMRAGMGFGTGRLSPRSLVSYIPPHSFRAAVCTVHTPRFHPRSSFPTQQSPQSLQHASSRESGSKMLRLEERGVSVGCVG